MDSRFRGNDGQTASAKVTCLAEMTSFPRKRVAGIHRLIQGILNPEIRGSDRARARSASVDSRARERCRYRRRNVGARRRPNRMPCRQPRADMCNGAVTTPGKADTGSLLVAGERRTRGSVCLGLQSRRDGAVGEADIVSRWLVPCRNVAFRSQSEAWEYVFGPIRVVYDRVGALELPPSALLVRNPG